LSHQTFVMAMVCASLGYLAPSEDALLLEVIDVAVIGNAPRALQLVAKNSGHFEAGQQRSCDPSQDEFAQPRMTERAGDKQVCLAFKGGSLNDAGR
jgi:hypothetical protein